MGLQTVVDALGDKKDVWISMVVKAYNLALSSAKLIEYVACHYLPEDLVFDVASHLFANVPVQGVPAEVMVAVLNKLDSLEKKVEQVLLERDIF